MARFERIHFLFDLDADGDLEKLASASGKTPHAGKGGHFAWQLTNDTGDDITVSLKSFTNADGLDVTDYLKFSPASRDVLVPGDPADNERSITAKVLKVDLADVKFTYEVWVDGLKIDPELIIDRGGGGGGPDPAARKGTKKSRKK